MKLVKGVALLILALTPTLVLLALAAGVADHRVRNQQKIDDECVAAGHPCARRECPRPDRIVACAGLRR